MNKSDLIAAIVTSHNIKLEANDPAFVLVELNRLVLENHSQELLKLLAEVSDQSTTTKETAISIQDNLNQILASVEATAMGMTKYAQQERTHQATNFKAITEHFAEENKKSTQSFKAHLWVIIALLSVLTILQIIVFAR